MIKKLTIWYNNLTVLKQLVFNFIVSWFLWFISGLLRDNWFLENGRSVQYAALNAIGMAFSWCIFFNWKKIKAVFSKPHKETTPSEF